jgi:hypothetical protein
VVTCGFSPIAIISLIAVGGAIMLEIIDVGYVSCKRGMTIAGSCSMVISARVMEVGKGTLRASSSGVLLEGGKSLRLNIVHFRAVRLRDPRWREFIFDHSKE